PSCPKKGTGTICRNGPSGASHKWCLSPFSDLLSTHRFARPPAADETVQHIPAQITGSTVHRQAPTLAGHLIDEIHQPKIIIVLNEGKGAEPDPLAGAGVDLLQGVPGGPLAGRVDQQEISTLQVGRGFAVGHANNLLVGGGLAAQVMPREA